MEYNSNVETDHKSIAATIFYQQPLSENHHLILNLSNTMSKTRSDYLLQNFVAESKNNQLEAYGTWSAKFGKAQLSAQTGLNLQSVENNSQKWTKPFMNANISFRIPVKNVQLSTMAYITPIVPSLSNLLENKQEYDGYLLSTGNPNLKTGYDLMMNQRAFWYGKKVYFGIHTTEIMKVNPIYQNVSYAGNGKFVRRPENAQKMWYVSPMLQAGVQELFGHITIGTSIAYNHYFVRLDDNSANTHNSIYGNISVFGYFGRWTVGTYIHLAGSSLNYQEITQSENISMLYLSYRLNDKFTISAQMDYFIDKEGFHNSGENLSKINPSKWVYNIPDNHCMFSLSFNYNVNFGRLFKKVNRSSKATPDKADVQLVQ